MAPPPIAVRTADAWRRRAFLALVALLPIHTLAAPGWISWKPFLVLVIALAAWDAVEGLRARSWPWHRPASAALAVLLAALAASWPGSAHAARYASLLLAVAAGGAVMLVIAAGVRREGTFRGVLRAVYWSGAAMAATAAAFGAVAVGAFGSRAGEAISGLPGVWRVVKPVYFEEGFVALTNWHNDPGYAAAWMNLWIALALVAVWLGAGSGRRWLDALVVGGLGYGVVMTFSRTGWLTLAVVATATAVLAVRAGAARAGEAVRAVGWAALVAGLLVAGTFAVDQRGVAGELDDQFAFRASQRATLATDAGPPPPSGVGDDRADTWSAYWDGFADRPLRGIGLGTGWEAPGLQEPHSLGLQLLGETGLIGLAGFLVLLVVIIAGGGGPIGRVALLAALIPAAFQTVLFEPTWWLAAGLLLAGGTSRRRARAPDPYRPPSRATARV